MERVFLHGLGQTPDSWESTLKTMEVEDIPHCLDLTRWLEGECSYSALYRGVAEYCDGLNGPFHLCGLSLGGVLALQYAIRRPDMIASLTLIGTQYVMPKRLLLIQNALFALMPERMFQSAGMGKRKMIALTRSMMDLDFEKELWRLDCPVLILCGERDRANRDAARKLKERLPHGELVFLKGAGHEVNKDAPQALGAELKRFMK